MDRFGRKQSEIKHEKFERPAGLIFSAFLRLPREIRDEVYKYIALENEEVWVDYKSRNYYRGNASSTNWFVIDPKFQARILEPAAQDRDGGDFKMSITTSLTQVNRQIRAEMSDLLQSCNLDVAARDRNFDFDHVIQYLDQLATRSRFDRHTVRHNGTVPQKLTLELSGPYDNDWQSNLVRWTEAVERLLSDPMSDLGALHKPVQSGGRWTIRTPTEIVWEVQKMHRARPIGAGRLELDKVFALR